MIGSKQMDNQQHGSTQNGSTDSKAVAMNATDMAITIVTDKAQLQAQFSRLQTLSRTKPILDWKVRETQLDNLEAMLRDSQDVFAKAISADFGLSLIHI